MAAKQSQPVKRPVAHQVRTVMLTRFKLSQQKRQLREKDRKTSESKSLPAPKSTEDKKHKGRAAASRGKREREDQQTSKLKRKIASKKIVMKARHELNKRKLNMQQKGLKSPPAKRMKTCNYFDPSGPDRSQSPVYSELGFEEVIRMVDENQSLDDEDLLEILTCPSPVWWEDPPDDEYVEGPINVNSPTNTPPPTASEQFRSKTSRKKTPHKLILEPENSTDNNNDGDKQDPVSVIDDATFKDIKKTDDRFKNKRSKLESLLSLLKNKKDQTKSEDKNIDNEDEELKPTHSAVPNRSKKESETELDDITFANISQQDKDSLKYLENIEIPMERKIKNHDKIESKPALDLGKVATVNNTFKVIKKSKNFPGFGPNKRWRILNIKKMAANPLIQKKHAQMNILSAKSLLKERQHTTEKPADVQSTIIEKNDINPKTDHEDEKDNDDKCKNGQNVTANDKMDDTNVPNEIQKSKNFVTVIKIISNTIDNKTQAKQLLEEVKEEVTEEVKAENELTDKESKTLDSYYKKCKGRKRDLKSNIRDNAEVRDLEIVKEESTHEEETELCDNCDKDMKKSIIVPSTKDVKYCLKCSCIFDKEECDYCIRKEREKQIIKEQSLENKSDEIANGCQSLTNTNNLVDIPLA